MAQTFEYDIEYINPITTLADKKTDMNAKGALGWRFVETDGHICIWIREASTNSDVVDAIEAQSSGSSSLTTFNVGLSTSDTALSDNSGNKIQLVNTDAVRTIYYRAVGSSDAWIPIAPLGASVLLLLTNSNLLEMKCDLLTATVYGIVYP